MLAEVLNFQGAKPILGMGSLSHLVEDSVFDRYMRTLFDSSDRYVIIYSCNFDKDHAQHVRCRKFDKWIEKNIGDRWKLLDVIKNEYPYDENDKNNTSWSDFYIYEKM